MKRIVLAIALLIAVGVSAQHAKVIPLDMQDSHDAQMKWEALQKAQADWDAVSVRVKKDYVDVSRGSKECGNTITTDNFCYRSGWENGFDFSSDFHYIVPKTQSPVQPCSGGWAWNGASPTIYCAGGAFTSITPTPASTINSPGVIQ